METKGITCKIPLELHERISEEIRETESTMSHFIEMVIREHIEKGANKVMEKGRTLAFQVSEELFQKVKAYLERYEQTYGRRLTQREFVIGLIEQALEEAEEEFEAARAAEQEERGEGGWEPPEEAEYGADEEEPQEEPEDETNATRDAGDGEDEAGDSATVPSWVDAAYSEEAEIDGEPDEADEEPGDSQDELGDGQEDAL